MKKILLICSFAFAMISAEAQSSKMFSAVNGTVDSIRCISTTPNYLYIAPVLAHKCATIQATVTRISAAAGGTIFLQGSVDNSNWYTATYNAGDTVTIANSASQALKIGIAPANGLPYKYYRLKCTGASSDTVTVRAVFFGRQ